MVATEIWSLALEAAATAAIVLSLLFLAFEQRRTRQQAELANWRDILQSFTDFKAHTNNKDVAALVARGHADYTGLSVADRLAFGLYLEQGVHICGNFLKHNDQLPKKLVGLEEAIANTLFEMLTSPGGAAWWDEAHKRGQFMADTYTVIDGLLERRRAKGAPLFA